MKTSPLLILSAILLVFLPSCSEKPVVITGQVFVVTKARENIKMGGLKVHIIPDQEFIELAKNAIPRMQNEVRKLAQAQVDHSYLTTFIKQLDRSAPPPEVTAIISEGKRTLGDIETTINTHADQSLFRQMVLQLISDSGAFPSQTTDADGRFTARVNGKTWFIATGERMVIDQTENYLWIVAFEPSGNSSPAGLVISNDSIVDSEDQLYSLLALTTGAAERLDALHQPQISDKIKSFVSQNRERAMNAVAKAERESADAAARAKREADAAREELLADLTNGTTGQRIAVPISDDASITLNWCPAGSFTMGSPNSEVGRNRDESQVRVSISRGFWLARTEVTQAQWQAVMHGNPSKFKGAELAVENVSWSDVQDFLAQVNANRNLPTGWRFILPTEAQWEYACRAGSVGPYHGKILNEIAWYSDNSHHTMHPVATKRPNAWGLHDMHGNVWEWCADWHSDRLAGGTDPEGPSAGTQRIARGGSWYHHFTNCRAATRDRWLPDEKNGMLGFRPALIRP